jgi:hypothetical protein
MAKGQFELATHNLCRIRGLPADHEYVAWELMEFRKSVETEKRIRGDDSYWVLAKQLFTSPGHMRRLAYGLGLEFFQTFSGTQALNYYSPIVFGQLGFSGQESKARFYTCPSPIGSHSCLFILFTDRLFATGLYGSVKFVCTMIFSFVFSLELVLSW